MRVSPLRKLYQLAEASLVPYGPAEGDCLVAETFGDIELEYAAIRKSCVLLDLPQRGVLEITGKDRVEFLNRMVTQELKGLLPYHTAKAFWLNRKGRIDADLRLIELGTRMLADVDMLAADRAIKGLASFAVMDDVVFKDVSESMHRLALHGPTGPALIQAVSKMVSGPAVIDLPAGAAAVVSIRGHEVVIDRDDSTGEIGLELTLAAGDVSDVFQHLIEVGQVQDDGNGGGAGGSGEPASKYRLRPAGWHAYNIARIEAGRPLYNLDFGPNSLPHESGILRERVSFTKGCYLGQEVVARMESRGHSKQMLMPIKCEVSRPPVPADITDPIPPRLPVTGSHIWQVDKPDSDPIGAVTSSTLSPMLGSTPVCFAMIKHEFAKPGLDVLVEADGERIRGKAQQSLAFWKRG